MICAFNVRCKRKIEKVGTKHRSLSYILFALFEYLILVPSKKCWPTLKYLCTDFTQGRYLARPKFIARTVP